MDREALLRWVGNLAVDVASYAAGGAIGFQANEHVKSKTGDDVAGAAVGMTVGWAVREVVQKIYGNPGAQLPSEARVRQMLEERLDLVWLVRGKDNGRPGWHYVRLDPRSVAAFRRALTTGTLDVSKYGQIIYSGWGENPPQDVSQAVQAMC